MIPAIIPSTSLNPVVVPSTSGSSSPQRSVAVIVDGDKELGALIELLIERSGVSQAEISRRLGIKPQSLNQYKFARRQRPSIQWMLRLAHACGAKIFVEFGVKDLR